MVIELCDRTIDTVISYFWATRDPEVRKYLPQKATTEIEALADFEKTQQRGATSYGRTIYVDGNYIGDVWCYCIQRDEPNAMVWPGRVLRKYHYTSAASSRHAGAARISVLLVLLGLQMDSRSSAKGCTGSEICGFQGAQHWGFTYKEPSKDADSDTLKKFF